MPFLGTFLTWTDSTSDLMLTYTSALMSDLQPLLVIIIAVAVGIIVVGAIISAIRGH